MVGHITIAMTRYIFLSFEQRCHDYPRTLGTLFFACSSEMRDINLVEALKRLFSLAMEEVRSASIVAEDVVPMLVDATMSVAVSIIQRNRRLSDFNNSILTI
jgi:hypothetical protein